MPRILLLSLAAALTTMGILNAVAVGDDASRTKNTSATQAGAKGEESLADSDAKSKSKTQTPLSSDSERSEDESVLAAEKAIVATGDSFVEAFNNADAKSIAEMFTKDAEYIDQQGSVTRGREAIAAVFQSSFETNPGAKIEMRIDEIKVVGPGVALEDGVTLVTRPERRTYSYSRYSAVHVLFDGKWLVASVREQTPKEFRQHRSRMEEMSWLQGEWVDEGNGAVVLFSCSPIDGGSFLLRRFAIRIGGDAAMSGEQRIGWDPLSRRYRSWIFDSEGGFSEGFWYRDENHWELKLAGVTADGQTASSTTIYTIVDENTMKWQSVDHEVGGVQLPDTPPITLVRRGPPPEADQTDSTGSK